MKRLRGLATDVRCCPAANAAAALRRKGEEPPPRETPRGPHRSELEQQITQGKPKERKLGLAFALLHADLTLLPVVHAALEDGHAEVRAEAALSCARLGDPTPLDLLLRWLQDRPAPKKSGPRVGAQPAPVRDALAAWNGLVELGDVRAWGDIAHFERDARYAALRHLHQGFDGSLSERHPAARLLGPS